MSDSIINPAQAALFAKNIYALVDMPTPELAFTVVKSTFRDELDINEKSFLSAKTGGPGFIKSRTAFGLMPLARGHTQVMHLS